MVLELFSRQNRTLASVLVSRRLLFSSPPSLSILRDRYGFVAPRSLLTENPNATSGDPGGGQAKKKKKKPPYRPPSSLDRAGQKPLHSDLPFDFRFSYTESNPSVKPIGLREPKYSPFGHSPLWPWPLRPPSIPTFLFSFDYSNFFRTEFPLRLRSLQLPRLSLRHPFRLIYHDQMEAIYSTSMDSTKAT